MRTLVVLALVGVTCAQLQSGAEEKYPPVPYKYTYSAISQEGAHSAEETGHGDGRVQGLYSMQLADGRVRTVTYVADEYGFRPSISTNELGTESRSPADAILESSAITAEEAAAKYGPQFET
ncbi:cuticle protein 10.9-like [Tropilaelaps mercedesae]|uniref:Cuticle protein 10.9-like n=1 Tax=Tropilaelaps mercedesae TaxID=418985 RepID=A0A1V9XA28_9ACAR|nr:cuticle protein 10.9-like [Tropilaelaps mercedesae]